MKKTLNSFWENKKMAANWKNKVIKQIELFKNWSKTRRFHCVSCQSETPPSIEMAEGRFCLNCAVKRLKDNLIETVDMQKWKMNRFADYLKKGSPADRLLVLYRFEEVLSIIGEHDGTKAFQLYQPLIRNLGYIHQHPLSSSVRQAAHEAAVEVGESLLPVLVCTTQHSSAVYYANVLLTAATIDPENSKVQNMLKKAVSNSSASVKKILLSAFEHIEESWIVPLLDIMSDDDNMKIREKATDLYVGIQKDTTDEQSKVKHVKPPKDLIDIINVNYKNDELKMIYDHYLHLFFDISYFGMINRLIRSKLKKLDMVHALATLLCDKNNFWLLMNAMHDDVYTVFERIAWEGGELSGDVLNRTLSEKVCEIKEEFIQDRIYKKNELNSKYSIFKVKKVHKMSREHGWLNDYQLSLPDMIRKYAQNYLPKPKYYELIGQTDNPESCQIFCDNFAIVHQLPLLVHYIQGNNLAIEPKTDKPTKISLNNMNTSCSIQEFYPAAKHEEKLLRTNLIACFLNLMSKGSIVKSIPPEQLLKEMLEYFFSGIDQYNYTFHTFSFLTYLKNWKKLTDSFHNDSQYQMEANFRENIWTLFKEMPDEQWISVDNIIKYCYFRNIDIRIAHPYMVSQYVHFSPSRYMNDRWENVKGKTYVSESSFSTVITVPAVKMFLFFLASFGIIDIAYMPPENDDIRTKNRPYLSEYDGLKYVRLNELGKYLSGKSKTFNFDPEKLSAQVTLDKDRLIAYLRGNDPVKKMVLDKIALMIHEGCYRVNYQIFLKDCRSKKDIDNKIELFYEYISADPPEVWQKFLDDISSKKDPLEEKMNLHVFKVKDNKELIELIARDEILRKLVLIAEDYHVLISEHHMKSVQRRLGDFGFFMDV
jgi:hypothetical protein